MSTIQVRSDKGADEVITLSELNNEDLYEWRCDCGETSDRPRVIADTIEYARVHMYCIHE